MGLPWHPLCVLASRRQRPAALHTYLRPEPLAIAKAGKGGKAPKAAKAGRLESPPPPAARRHGGVGGVRKLVTALGGARLCYGEPVRAGEHTLIPVARVRAVGGGGFGGDALGRGDGGGGGGLLDAAPVGFIAVSRDGARFEPIPDPAGRARALRTGLGALTGLAGAVAASRAVRRRRPAALRSPRRLLPR